MSFSFSKYRGLPFFCFYLLIFFIVFNSRSSNAFEINPASVYITKINTHNGYLIKTSDSKILQKLNRPYNEHYNLGQYFLPHLPLLIHLAKLEAIDQNKNFSFSTNSPSPNQDLPIQRMPIQPMYNDLYVAPVPSAPMETDWTPNWYEFEIKFGLSKQIALLDPFMPHTKSITFTLDPMQLIFFTNRSGYETAYLEYVDQDHQRILFDQYQTQIIQTAQLANEKIKISINLFQLLSYGTVNLNVQRYDASLENLFSLGVNDKVVYIRDLDIEENCEPEKYEDHQLDEYLAGNEDISYMHVQVYFPSTNEFFHLHVKKKSYKKILKMIEQLKDKNKSLYANIKEVKKISRLGLASMPGQIEKQLNKIFKVN